MSCLSSLIKYCITLAHIKELTIRIDNLINILSVAKILKSGFELIS